MATTTSTTSLSNLDYSITSDEKESSSTLTSSSTPISSLSSPKEEEESLSSDIINEHYDIKAENKKLHDIINISLLEIDYKTGKEINNGKQKWTVHNTKDKNVQVIYRKLENEKMITMRSTMDINCNINEVYNFFDCSINDDLKLALKNDKMMTSYNVTNIYNNNRCLVHTTFSTGAPKAVVKPRDFFYMKKRFKYNNYNNSNMNVHGILGYSVDSTHPNYMERVSKHVRGWIHNTGVIVIEKSENICTLCYVVCVDLCGKIPKKIVNFATPQQGMNIKNFAASIDEARDMVKRRKSSVNKIN